MIDQKAKNPIPAANAASDDLKSYFEKILPNYDRDKVHVSHIKKVIKWYNQLDKTGLLDADPPKKDEKKEKKEKDGNKVEKKDAKKKEEKKKVAKKK